MIQIISLFHSPGSAVCKKNKPGLIKSSSLGQIKYTLFQGFFFVKTCAEYLIGYFLPFSFLVITTRII